MLESVLAGSHNVATVRLSLNRAGPVMCERYVYGEGGGQRGSLSNKAQQFGSKQECLELFHVL